MDGFSWSLVLAAAGIGVTHTVLGPDHYVPFILLAHARRWSVARTTLVTGVCGVAHVLSSVALGAIGVAVGVAVGSIERVETVRGGLAAWALVAFGLAYGVWGARRALRRRRGLEPHAHEGHVHLHAGGDRRHRHTDTSRGPGSGATFWTLLTLFVLGPCEPLVPLFVLPASRGRWALAATAAAVYGVVTIGAMVTLALLGSGGIRRARLEPLHTWSHALAGGIIAASGMAVLLLGL